tara:strand:+ start:121 stop:618 length:498 start_codon:yes stop_codon:yes gene_type:complete
MKPVIVLDNVLNKGEMHEYLFYSESVGSEGSWVDYSLDIDSYSWKILDIAGNYYDLSKIKGFEIWTHNNSKPAADENGGWHYDKDEYRFGLNKILSFPVCSIIYYAKAHNLRNGKLLIEDNIMITPKQNRLVIFGPGKKHYVQDFTGDRFSVNINPWNRLLEEYK